ncbi:uncharacterized GPI-anchored protein At3g06035 [Manihot esculenta]|uniref:Uncharacterized GPI-anchored protein At5g19230-like domain-containing protein n=1 Tax=Manihot esculenta TaxID=3983 RepID=A0A2C9VFN0_MANES|nr:uncharacterized GPI-anchored protein At3g06035 [Manihot esculenta]OAY44095.1 hypothetical protein MANES_08G122100v8 [Manihot esculenta]
MASLKFGLFLLAIFFLSSPARSCGDDDDDLLKCLNCHRAFLDLPTFTKNTKAECLADEVAKNLEKKSCEEAKDSNPYELDKHPELLSKCDINVSHTKDGVVLPVCVPKLDLIAVFTNYTRTYFAKYINDSKFAEAGVASNGDWMVVALSTNTPGGDFAGANGLVSMIGLGHCLVSFLVGMLVFAEVPLGWW